MSRTYRRKGPEPEWMNDEEFYFKFFHRTLKQQYARYHSDAYSVVNCGSWGKRKWAKMRRSWDRQEFAKLAKYVEYEPIWFTSKIDTWWWD